MVLTEKKPGHGYASLSAQQTHKAYEICQQPSQFFFSKVVHERATLKLRHYWSFRIRKIMNQFSILYDESILEFLWLVRIAADNDKTKWIEKVIYDLLWEDLITKWNGWKSMAEEWLQCSPWGRQNHLNENWVWLTIPGVNFPC